MAIQVDLVEVEWDGDAPHWIVKPFYRMENGKVSGLHPKCDYVNEVGIIAGPELRELFPKDGMEFMEGLQCQFRGGYFTATPPCEVPDGKGTKPATRKKKVHPRE